MYPTPRSPRPRVLRYPPRSEPPTARDGYCVCGTNGAPDPALDCGVLAHRLAAAELREQGRS